MMETKKPCKDNEASHSIKNVDFRSNLILPDMRRI